MENCKNCKEYSLPKDVKIPETVPYAVYESTCARHSINIKRLVQALIVSIALIFASNIAWLVYIYQYDFTTTSEEITVDGTNGVANYIGQDGNIYNGENSDKANEGIPNPEEENQIDNQEAGGQ